MCSAARLSFKEGCPNIWPKAEMYLKRFYNGVTNGVTMVLQWYQNEMIRRAAQSRNG
jgi:hypothetical protein